MTTPSSDEAINRVLYLAPKIHIYTLPPLTSNKGYTAAAWTNPAPNDPNPAREIFVARMRVLETATLTPSKSSSPQEDEEERITVSILLEDPSTGALFAEAPYTSTSVVQAAVDSSRFFAVRVVSDQGPPSGGRGGGGAGKMTATLGIGFEDRGEAMEFGICLQGVAKVLGFGEKEAVGGRKAAGANVGGRAVKGGGSGTGTGTGTGSTVKKDWSLKEGESIKVDVGGRGIRKREDEKSGGGAGDGDPSAALFSIPPPPPPLLPPPHSGSKGGGDTAIPLLAPPPSTPMSTLRAEKRRSREIASLQPQTNSDANAKALGFDDGEFGEFQ